MHILPAPTHIDADQMSPIRAADPSNDVRRSVTDLAVERRAGSCKMTSVSMYQEHPSKVAAWRDGQFIAMPEAEQADSTVWFAFGGDEDGPKWEGLLAARDDAGTAMVLSVPFFVYDLALGDEVSTVESAEGALVAETPMRRSGDLTFRVVFEGDADERWQELMRDLEPWSCWFDVRSPRFVAISAPSEHAQAVADYLHGREQRGELQYETGQTK